MSIILLFLSGGKAHAQSVVVRDTVVIRDTVLIYIARQKSEPDTLKRERHFVFAPGTNLLFDAALTPNLEIEFPIGSSRWSVLAEWWTPWYRWHGEGRKNRAYQLLLGGVEGRYWFSARKNTASPTVLKGHFVGIYGAGGMYDLEWDTPAHQGWQGEFWSAGLTYGYAFAVGRSWRLALSLSAGYVGGPQRVYEGQFNDEHLIWQGTRRFSYFGPTKAKVTLSYLIGWKVRQKGGGR